MPEDSAVKPPSASLHLDAGREFDGAQQQLLDLLRGMQRRGHRVLLGCPRSAPLFSAATAAHVPCLPLTLRSGFDFPSAVRLARLVSSGEFDLVHAHDPASYSIAHAAQGISRHHALRQNLFLTCRQLDSEPGAFEPARLDEPGSHWVATSRRVRDQLLRRGADPARVVQVPACVDLERMAPVRDRAVTDPWGLAGSAARVVGAVTRFTRQNNPLLLVDAFARLHRRHPETRLLLAGDGPLRRALQQRVAQQQLADFVIFAGTLDDAGPAYSAMHVFVQAADVECSCTALLDAMSAGVPVVAAACAEVLELARHGESAYVVPPRDPDVMAEALERVLEQEDLAQRLVEGGARLARQHSIEAAVDATLEAYGRFCGGADPGQGPSASV
jgi:glycosyltransferase involved in cell wall biosynthesis